MATGSTSSNVVGVHYRVGKKIGEGSFGVIFEGTNLLNQQQVAIKFEPRKSDAPQLRDEYRTYKILVGCRKFNSRSSQSHVHNNQTVELYSYDKTESALSQGGAGPHFVRGRWDGKSTGRQETYIAAALLSIQFADHSLW
jgi:serine/threonine protein kinase